MFRSWCGLDEDLRGAVNVFIKITNSAFTLYFKDHTLELWTVLVMAEEHQNAVVITTMSTDHRPLVSLVSEATIK